MKKNRGVGEIFERLAEEYPDAKTELIYASHFQLLIAVILSAQCTDARVNQTTPALFKQFPDAKAMAKASLKEIEALIHSCGFYRMKAKALVSAASDLVEKFNGEVPNELGKLVKLRGVGRKTASVVLNQAFELPAIAVDTHVKRVCLRLGWTNSTNPIKIERDLMVLVPKPQWGMINTLLILHGRKTCKARTPLCETCSIRRWCQFYQRSIK